MEADEEEKRRAEAAEAAAEQQRQLETAKATVLAAARLEPPGPARPGDIERLRDLRAVSQSVRVLL